MEPLPNILQAVFLLALIIGWIDSFIGPYNVVDTVTPIKDAKLMAWLAMMMIASGVMAKYVRSAVAVWMLIAINVDIILQLSYMKSVMSLF